LHAVIIELQEQLLAWERELDSREVAIVTWEEGLVAFACALGEVSAEFYASRARVDVVQWKFSTQACTSSSWSWQLTDLGRMLEERQTLLCLQEMDLEVQEALLAEELECYQHPPSGQDLSAELNQARIGVDMINGECTIEAERLSRQVMWTSRVLVYLCMLPVQDIPQLPKSAQEVLLAFDLVLNRLQEALASDVSLWD
jgi:hypothetical protein